MIFATIDSTNRPVRFYDKAIFNSADIPGDALPISVEMRDFAVQWPGQVRWNGEAFERCAPPTPRVSEGEARAKRNSLLSASDRTQLPDFPITEEAREQWRVYRQTLRNLPSSPGWPGKVDWPIPPS